MDDPETPHGAIGADPRSPALVASAGDPAEAARALAAIAEEGLLEEDLEVRFNRVLSMVCGFFHMDRAAIAVVDGDEVLIKAHHALQTASGPLSGSFTETVLREGRTVVVEDLEHDPRFAGDSPLRRTATAAMLGHPLRARNGELIGAVTLGSAAPHTFSERALGSFEVVVAWIEDELAKESDARRAAEVQRALQPRRSAVLPGYDIAGGLAAAREVGGDFFDWRVRGEELVIVLGDVMGKGVGAALLAATVRATIRTTLMMTDTERHIPVGVSLVEDDLVAAGSFATLFYATLQGGSGALEYADAGHGLAMIVRPDGCERLADEALPLGLGGDAPDGYRSTTIGPGESFVVVSDGVLDLFDGTLASLDRVAELVRESADSREVVDELLRRARSERSADDVAVVAVRRL